MHTSRAVVVFFAVTIGASCAAQLPANVLVVRADAQGGGDGLSWTTAFNDLQSAIDAANLPGSTTPEIWVASGSYHTMSVSSTPSAGYYNAGSISISGSVAVYGGFAGVESSRGERDPAVNTCRIVPPPAPGPVRCITLTMSDDARLDGFSISGTSVGTDSTSGVVMRKRATIANSRIAGHCTCDGGGAGVEMHDDATLDHCRITQMRANWAGVAGVSASDRSRVISCVIDNNRSADGSASYAGATGGKDVRFISCVFANNVSGRSGGGAALNGGTAINCLFTKNSGGYSSTRVVSGATLINCTIVDNTFGCAFAADGIAINTIVYRNTRIPPCDTWAPVPGPTFSGTAQYSTIERWDSSIRGTGSDGLDPLLDLNGRLTLGSPAIDAGDDFAVPPGVWTDLDDKARFLGGTSGAGVGPSPRVDRGAYEFGDAPIPFCYANIDNSQSTTPAAADFVRFLELFRAGHPLANCDGSIGSPALTVADFVCFLNAFRAGCP